MARAPVPVAIGLRLDREQNGIRQRDRRYPGKFDFWRATLPGALTRQRPDSQGAWVSKSLTVGELVAPWTERNIHRAQRSASRLQRRLSRRHRTPGSGTPQCCRFRNAPASAVRLQAPAPHPDTAPG
jgi:hypothetical protein